MYGSWPLKPAGCPGLTARGFGRLSPGLARSPRTRSHLRGRLCWCGCTHPMAAIHGVESRPNPDRPAARHLGRGGLSRALRDARWGRMWGRRGDKVHPTTGARRTGSEATDDAPLPRGSPVCTSGGRLTRGARDARLGTVPADASTGPTEHERRGGPTAIGGRMDSHPLTGRSPGDRRYDSLPSPVHQPAPVDSAGGRVKVTVTRRA